jgi:hypothetical protein
MVSEVSQYSPDMFTNDGFAAVFVTHKPKGYTWKSATWMPIVGQTALVTTTPLKLHRTFRVWNKGVQSEGCKIDTKSPATKPIISRAGQPGFGSRQGQWWEFFSSPLRPDRLWGPTQSPIHWVPRALTPGVKRPLYEADPLTSVSCRS